MQYTNYNTDFGPPVPAVAGSSSTGDQNQQKTQFGQSMTQYGQPQTQFGQSQTQTTQFGQPIQGQPQSHYGQPIAGQPQTLILPPQIIITQDHFKPYETKCPHCNAQITTETKFVMGQTANMCLITMLCSFIWFGLFCFIFIPCFYDGWKDVQHVCPHCHNVVAEYQRHKIAPQYQSPWLRPRGYHPGWMGGFQPNQPLPEAPPGILVVQPKPPVTDQHFRPYTTTCPHCRAQITTETSFHMGSYAWYCIFILTCIFIWFGIFCVLCLPCVIDKWKDITHTCPRCHKVVAEYYRHEMM